MTAFAQVIETAAVPIEETAAFDRALQPARVYAAVTGRDPLTQRPLAGVEPATDEQLVEMFRQARSLNQNSWIAMAIVCGEATERVGDDRRGYRRLARSLECHKSEVVRLVRIYRGIIKPRIERDGDGAVFEVQQQVYYSLACEAAAQTKRATPLELLERVEARRDQGRYTSREFKDELISEGYIKRGVSAIADGAAQCLEAITVLGEQPDDIVERAAHLALPEESRWRDAIAEARARLDLFERALDGERAAAVAAFG